MRLTPKLTLTLGFRDEFTNGWNEAHGRAANYTFTNGVISTHAQCGQLGLHGEQRESSCRSRALGLAWSPFGDSAKP